MSGDIPIQRRMIMTDEDYPAIDFTHDATVGRVRTYLNTSQNKLHIDDFEVAEEARRRGVGKALLTAVRELAHDLEVDEVSARIISRECLDAMNAVYGKESVHIRRLGVYDAGHHDSDGEPTSASLRYFPGQAGRGE